MEKIKITLNSGNVIEKSLLTAFLDENKTYVIFDNETNGSMGLPIILVTTLSGTKLEKIPDKSQEWENAKNLLRSIINSEPINYVSIPSEVQADELYYTQLTLPVASFEVLKNNYNVVSTESNTNDTEISISNSDEVAVSDSTLPELEVAENKIEPIVSDSSHSDQDADVAKEVVNSSTKKIDIALEKEAFMKACENMFDALVSKFDN